MITNLKDDLNHIVDFSKLSDNSIIVDVGCNAGKFIQVLRNYESTKNCLIIGIEPSKSHIKILESQNFKNVKILNRAMVPDSSTIQKVKFYEFQGEKKKDGNYTYHQWGNIYGNHLEKMKIENVNVFEYEVQTIDLKKLIEEYNKIDFLKMDIEGSETEIIENLDFDVCSKINQISFEYHDSNMISKTKEKLTSLGYTIIEYPNHEIYCFK